VRAFFNEKQVHWLQTLEEGAARDRSGPARAASLRRRPPLTPDWRRPLEPWGGWDSGTHQVLFHDPTGEWDLLSGAYVSTAIGSGRAQPNWERRGWMVEEG